MNRKKVNLRRLHEKPPRIQKGKPINGYQSKKSRGPRKSNLWPRATHGPGSQ